MNARNFLPKADLDHGDKPFLSAGVFSFINLDHGTSQILRTEISRSHQLGYLVLLICQLKGSYVILLMSSIIAHSDR